MRQVVQSPRTGELELVEVPAPSPGRGQVLVRNHFSVVSTGTETLSMAFARMSMLGKARSRPDLTRQVVHKLREEGPLPTYRTVMNRLDAPQPLGYSSAGVVEEVGPATSGFSPGDRVACAGAGYANHAEFVIVPENLAARVPETVALEDAAFATLGAIALQGVRVAAPALGEIGAVIGLGLIGQLTVQLLRANGCRVLGVDLDPERVKRAIEQGAEWAETAAEVSRDWVEGLTGGWGVDFALVTASAKSSAPLSLAAELCRSKGRVTVVGAMPMELDRRTFYERELDLRMSMSYGPGRYDRSYEESGYDYPLPYVRWTENRNLQAFLALLANGSVRPGLLQPRIRPFAEALETYDSLVRGTWNTVAALFRYDVRAEVSRRRVLEAPKRAPQRDDLRLAFLGAGNYAKSVLLPILDGEGGLRRATLVTATGASARRTAERFHFERCATDVEDALGDPEVDLVFVATRHSSHASLAARALRAGKAVWLEKPLGLSREALADVRRAAEETGGFLAVGYNRRFSPHTRALRETFASRAGPLAIRYTVAAGAPPRGSWLLDPEEGGGRIVGEACHFVDLCTYLVGALPVQVFARALGRDEAYDDSVVAMLGFADGSTATIEYLAHASPSVSKERIEVSGGGRTATCENFRVTRITGRRELRTFNQDKGQSEAIRSVLAALRKGQPSPFGLEELLGVSEATFAILDSAQTARAVPVEIPAA